MKFGIIVLVIGLMLLPVPETLAAEQPAPPATQPSIDVDAPDVGLLYVRSPAQVRLLRVNPQAKAEDLRDSALLDETWKRAIASHVRMLRGGVADYVIYEKESPIRQTGWFKSFAGPKPVDDARAALRSALVIEAVPDTSLIAIRAGIKPAGDAAIVVKEICKLYVDRNAREFQQNEELRLDLMKREYDQIVLELNTEIIPQLRNKEQLLGGDGVGTFFIFNMHQQVVERMLQQRLAAMADRDAAKAELDALEEKRAVAVVPASFRQQAEETPRVQRLRAQLEAVALERADAAPSTRPAEGADAGDQRLARREKVLQEMLSDALKDHTDLARDTHAESLQSRLSTAEVSIERLSKQIDSSAQTLGRLNKDMNDYRVLQDREAHLRDQLRKMGDEMRHVKEYWLQLNYSEVGIGRYPETPN